MNLTCILSCRPGKISHDFAIALFVHNSTMTAVAAGALGEPPSRLRRAEAFAETFDIPQSYSSYEDLANAEDVDVVYIGNTNNLHFTVKEVEGRLS